MAVLKGKRLDAVLSWALTLAAECRPTLLKSHLKSHLPGLPFNVTVAKSHSSEGETVQQRCPRVDLDLEY